MVTEIEKQLCAADMRQVFDQTLQDRVVRKFEIDHQKIIGSHHFAHASSECIDLYVGGYFLSAVMVSQAVCEGLLKFVAERNKVSWKEEENKKYQDVLHELLHGNVISNECSEAFKRIFGSFRNDYHHMNPKLGTFGYEDHRDLAKRNLEDLSTIEKEIFAANINSGALVPLQPQYWDTNANGTVPVYLRCE